MTNQFITKVAGIVALCTVLLVISASTLMAQKKVIGLQLYSVRDSMQVNPQRTIEAVAKMGYAYVEAAGYKDGLFYGMTPEAFKALLKANKLYMPSSHTGQPLPDAAKWNETMAWWDQCIDAHIAVGAKYIIQPFMDKVGFESIAGNKRYCEYFNAIGDKCKAKGLLFGYHNHDKEFADIDGTTIYDNMLKNTDPSKVCFELDLWWIHVGGKKAVDYFNKYPGRFVFYHVKDEEEVGASGKIDFKPYFDNAKKAGTKYFIVEAEKSSVGSSLESAKKSLEFLMKAKYVK
ncbi:MAG: sugar phosphate isomerase/epimerase [Bacteroidetes bacterium]|nr:sugar phosphate isomerase/epimerase [Bacteroidota bacterium]